MKRSILSSILQDTLQQRWVHFFSRVFTRCCHYWTRGHLCCFTFYLAGPSWFKQTAAPGWLPSGWDPWRWGPGPHTSQSHGLHRVLLLLWGLFLFHAVILLISSVIWNQRLGSGLYCKMRSQVHGRLFPGPASLLVSLRTVGREAGVVITRALHGERSARRTRADGCTCKDGPYPLWSQSLTYFLLFFLWN